LVGDRFLERHLPRLIRLMFDEVLASFNFSFENLYTGFVEHSIMSK